MQIEFDNKGGSNPSAAHYSHHSTSSTVTRIYLVSDSQLSHHLVCATHLDKCSLKERQLNGRTKTVTTRSKSEHLTRLQ